MDAVQALREIKNGNIHSCYLLYGEEEYLKKKILEELKVKLLKEEMISFNFDVFSGKKKSLAEIISRAESPAVLSHNRLIIVTDAPYFSEPLKDIETQKLQNYLEKPAPETCLVFMSSNIDKRKKFTKLMLKNNWAILCEPVKGSSLSKWIRKKLKQQDKDMDSETLQLLTQRTGNNLHKLENELNKLICYMEEERVIPREAVDLLVTGSVEVSIFELVDSLGRRDKKQALTLLQGILRMNEHPLKILTMIARQFRLLIQAKSCLEEGIPRREIASSLKVPPFVVNKLMAQADNFSPSELAQALVLSHETDIKIKTGRLDPYEAMDLLLAGIMN